MTEVPDQAAYSRVAIARFGGQKRLMVGPLRWSCMTEREEPRHVCGLDACLLTDWHSIWRAIDMAVRFTVHGLARVLVGFEWWF